MQRKFSLVLGNGAALSKLRPTFPVASMHTLSQESIIDEESDNEVEVLPPLGHRCLKRKPSTAKQQMRKSKQRSMNKKNRKPDPRPVQLLPLKAKAASPTAPRPGPSLAYGHVIGKVSATTTKPLTSYSSTSSLDRGGLQLQSQAASLGVSCYGPSFLVNGNVIGKRTDVARPSSISQSGVSSLAGGYVIGARVVPTVCPLSKASSLCKPWTPQTISTTVSRPPIGAPCRVRLIGATR